MALLLLAIVFTPRLALLLVERTAFSPPPAGTVTPDMLGVWSEQFSFSSGDRQLRASWVPVANQEAPAVLIFHGNEENISRWAPVQRMLHDNGISSLVFDYSGYGASTGLPTVQSLEQDGLAAYNQFLFRTRRASHRYALGFSLGSAVLLDTVDRMQPRPQGMIIAAGFASARETVVSTGLAPWWIAKLLPDLWNNEERIRAVSVPVLIVHSSADEVVPFGDAERLCRAAGGAAQLVRAAPLLHDAPLEPGSLERFWQPIVDYIVDGAMSRFPKSPCSPQRADLAHQEQTPIPAAR